MPLLIFALVLLLAGMFLLLRSRQRGEREGLPQGKLIYEDRGQQQEQGNVLYAARLGLSGKPDYIIRSRGVPVPVEVKSRPAPHQPYDSHVFQLAAYCLLVEECFGQRPPHGIIRYADQSFQIDYTPQLEAALNDLLEEMRQCEPDTSPARSHALRQRCAACGYAGVCDQYLD